MKKLFACAFVMTLIFLGVDSCSSYAHAQVVAGPLDGWLWSDNIGWISVNCINGGAMLNNICGTSQYTVVDSSGNLTGDAWSDNIGWIKFGGLTGFPSGNNTTNSNAKIDPTTGAFSGWVQALAGAGRADGWDGWISLGGQTIDGSSAYNFGYAGSTGIYNGWAWGSDVVGWINATSTSSSGHTSCDPSVEFCPCNPAIQICTGDPSIPAVTLSVSPISVNADGATHAILSWTSQDVTSCTASTIANATASNSSWTGNVGLTSPNSYDIGTFSTTTLAGDTLTNTYTLTCNTGATPSTVSTSANLTIKPFFKPPFGGEFCKPIDNATICSYEKTTDPNSSVSGTLINSGASCTATQATPEPTYCEQYCNTGFHQRGNICVLDSIIHEN